MGGKRGRPAKPTRLKILQGNPGKRRIEDGEPVPRADDENPAPDWLCSVRGAREAWDQIADELAGIGLLTVIDRTSLEALCVSYAIWRDAISDCEENGYTITQERTHGGGPVRVKNPSFVIAKEALQDFVRISAKFGMTPSDRAGLATGGKKESDPLADLISSMKESRTA